MAPKSDQEQVHGYVEELDAPQSPGADYGLKNGDGFDPAKYDFYNPISRNAQEAFVVCLEEWVQNLRSEAVSVRMVKG